SVTVKSGDIRSAALVVAVLVHTAIRAEDFKGSHGIIRCWLKLSPLVWLWQCVRWRRNISARTQRRGSKFTASGFPSLQFRNAKDVGCPRTAEGHACSDHDAIARAREALLSHFVDGHANHLADAAHLAGYGAVGAPNHRELTCHLQVGGQ